MCACKGSPPHVLPAHVMLTGEQILQIISTAAVCLVRADCVPQAGEYRILYLIMYEYIEI